MPRQQTQFDPKMRAETVPSTARLIEKPGKFGAKNMAGLQWIRLDTTFFDNGKIASLVDESRHRTVVAHLSGMCHVGKIGTDGFLPENALRRFAATKRDANECVAAGLWIPSPGGYEINGWADFQVANLEAKARSEKARAAAQARWGMRNEQG